MGKASMPLGFPPFAGAVKLLVLACSAIYLLQALLTGAAPGAASDLLLWFGLVPAAVTHGWLWQLVTYSFLHGGLFHLLFNMLALWMFGSQFEGDWGRARFLELYFFSIIGAALTTVAIAYTGALGLRPDVVTVGASGGIYGLLIAYGITYAEREIFLMLPPIAIKAKYFVAILMFIAIASALQGGGNIARLAHLGGLLFGFLYVKVVPKRGFGFGMSEGYFNLRNRYIKYKRRQAGKKFEVYMREHDPKKYFDQYGNYRGPESSDDKDPKGPWVN